MFICFWETCISVVFWADWDGMKVLKSPNPHPWQSLLLPGQLFFTTSLLLTFTVPSFCCNGCPQCLLPVFSLAGQMGTWMTWVQDPLVTPVESSSSVESVPCTQKSQFNFMTFIFAPMPKRSHNVSKCFYAVYNTAKLWGFCTHFFSSWGKASTYIFVRVLHEDGPEFPNSVSSA